MTKTEKGKRKTFAESEFNGTPILMKPSRYNAPLGIGNNTEDCINYQAYFILVRGNNLIPCRVS